MLCRALPLVACVAIASTARSAADALPSDWIDPRTGHRVIRLSPDSGAGSLYFHQRGYTPEGDRIVLRSREGILAVDLSTLGRSAPRAELVLAGAAPIATAWRTREAYFFDREANTLRAVHLDTKVVREVVKLPPLARGTQFALNCDETLLVAIGPDPDGVAVPRTAPPGGMGGTLEAQWAAGTPKRIYTINVRTGEMRVLHRENDWTNHLQCSPTDPQQILFCHEGPWHFVNRTWTLRADGGPPRALHQRTMNMEIWGHEFFSHDGKTVWFDLQTPRSTVFWLAGVELATGRRTWYHLKREEWSVHYNISPDGKLFAGDGGGPGSVAARSPDGEILNPPGNGMWIYLFRPVMVRGNSFRDGGPLIDIGEFRSERLVDMSRHDYSKDRGVEPNLTFTPDGKWIIFSGNFHSPRDERGRAVTHTYAVELARRRDPAASSPTP
ncbi:MAG: oligogalacturonate lyase [Verrucomicrobia bacterium]|nr:oligogalacturonate lyase [Verrucomicrobiota bacterium]